MINSYPATINSDTNASLGYDTYLIDATNNDVNLTLPDMTGMGAGKDYYIIRTDSIIAKTVTITATGTTINGSASITLSIKQNITLTYFDGIWNYTQQLGIQPPSWIKIVKSHTDFQAASLSNDIEIFSMPAGGMIHGVVTKQSVQFSGTGIVTYTLSVGIAGNLTKYAVPFAVDTAPSNTNFQQTGTYYCENWGAVTSVRSQAISTGANLDQSTAGTVSFFLLISQVK